VLLPVRLASSSLSDPSSQVGREPNRYDLFGIASIVLHALRLGPTFPPLEGNTKTALFQTHSVWRVRVEFVTLEQSLEGGLKPLSGRSLEGLSIRLLHPLN